MVHSLAFKGSVFALRIGGVSVQGYAALWALAANLAATVVFSALFAAAKVARGEDATRAEDYGEP